MRAMFSPRTPSLSWRRLPLWQQKSSWGLESLGGTDSSPRCSSRNFQQRWRLAQASSFVDRLAQIARGEHVARDAVFAGFLRNSTVSHSVEVHFRAFNRTGLTLPILRVGHGGPRGSVHFKTKPRVSWRDEIDFAVSEGLEGISVSFALHTQGACSRPRCVESPGAKLQRVSSEDCRTAIRGQAVKQSAEMRSALHSPSDVVGKVPVRSCRECHRKT